MDTLLLYLAVSLGVVISIMLPILRQMLPVPGGQEKAKAMENRTSWIWKLAKPYVITAIFSLLVAFLILAAMPELEGWRNAIIAGFTADSILQKIVLGKN